MQYHEMSTRSKGTCTFLPRVIAANTKFTSLSSLKPTPRASPHFVAFCFQGLCEVVVSPVVWRISLNAHAQLIKGTSSHQVQFHSIYAWWSILRLRRGIFYINPRLASSFVVREECCSTFTAQHSFHHNLIFEICCCCHSPHKISTASWGKTNWKTNI